MKVKDFLEWFFDINPESELKFDLFELIVSRFRDYKEVHTPLYATAIDYLDETDIVFVTLEWGD